MQSEILSIPAILAEESSSSGSNTHSETLELPNTDNCALNCQHLDQTLTYIRGKKKQREKKTYTDSVISRNNTPQFSFGDLQKSEAGGCSCCAFFKLLIQAFFSAHPDLTLSDSVFEWKSYMKFTLLVDPIQDGVSPFLLQLFSPEGNSPNVAGIPQSRVLTGDTSSSLSTERLKQMISTCEKTHSHCGEGRNQKLPRRVLDLRKLEVAGGVKLIDTSESSAPDSIAEGTYACLSHCWGKGVPIQTRKATLSTHMSFIPLSDLPPTFRDAARLCRQLELDFLWIDSLCIIQDSMDDWKQESSQMASIYTNSYITIAAVSSPDCNGGCFVPNAPDICLKVRGLSKDVTLGLRQQPSEDFQTKYPLLSRAWVYQERMLSRRIAYCTRGELRLECRAGRTRCECGSPALHHDARTESALRHLNAKRHYSRPDLIRQHKGQQASKPWQDVVARYTVLRLTKPSDKLPALAGCARDLSSEGDPWRGRYLAGLWEATLVPDLLWVVNPPADLPRPGEWRAPSWSWASVDTTAAGIRYFHMSFEQDGSSNDSMVAFRRRITEVVCEPSTPGGDGMIAVDPDAAFIKLRAGVLRDAYVRRACHRCAHAWKHQHAKFAMETRDVAFHDRVAYRGALCSLPVEGLDVEGNGLQMFPDVNYHDQLRFEVQANEGGHCRAAKVALLHVVDCRSKSGKGEGGLQDQSFFMLLEPVKGAQEHVYERVGLMIMIFQSSEVKRDWFERCFQPRVSPEALITLK